MTRHHVSVLIRMGRFGIQDAREAFEGGKGLVKGVVIAAASLKGLRKIDLLGGLRNGSIKVTDRALGYHL